ncbi:MAG: transporter substrate-binding domain-containing protein [Desulfobacteraceae bacterium]|nr:transporter substrate-binding domain-containing protein [Desulfobacteraceae bacterium]
MGNDNWVLFTLFLIVAAILTSSPAFCDGRSKELLDRGRIDLAVFSRYFGLYVIRQLGLKGIRVLEPPLAVRPMFLYLHRKHMRLIPLLTAALVAMKTDGTFTEIRQKTLLPYLNDPDRWMEDTSPLETFE